MNDKKENRIVISVNPATINHWIKMRFDIQITDNSGVLIDEIKRYQHNAIGEQSTINDDSEDVISYATYTHLKNKLNNE